MPSWSRPPSRGKRLQALPGPSRSQKRWKGNRDGFQCPPQAFQSVTALGDDTAGGMGTRTGTRGHQQRLCGWDVPAAPSPSSRCHPGALQGTLWPRAGAVGAPGAGKDPQRAQPGWVTHLRAAGTRRSLRQRCSQKPSLPSPSTPTLLFLQLQALLPPGSVDAEFSPCKRACAASFSFFFLIFFFFPVLGILVERDKSKKQQSCSESEKGR